LTEKFGLIDRQCVFMITPGLPGAGKFYSQTVHQNYPKSVHKK